MTDKVLEIQLRNISRNLSRQFTLLELLKFLKNRGIFPVGNITNTPKEKIAFLSLKGANKTTIDKFIASLNLDGKEVKKESRYTNLHNEFLGTKVDKFIQSGHWDEAVRVANVRIVNRVKKLSGLNEDGVSLVQKAFSPKNPILQLSKIPDEQVGLMHLFIGAVFAFRNPPSHDDENKWPEEECVSKLHLANYLMAVLDKAEKVDHIYEVKLQLANV